MGGFVAILDDKIAAMKHTSTSFSIQRCVKSVALLPGQENKDSSVVAVEESNRPNADFLLLQSYDRCLHDDY
jgi:hypothetical protein